jgi:predicted deacetylase
LCDGSEHKERMDAARSKLAKSHWWNKNGGADHIFIAPWWGAKVQGSRKRGGGIICHG